MKASKIRTQQDILVEKQRLTKQVLSQERRLKRQFSNIEKRLDRMRNIYNITQRIANTATTSMGFVTTGLALLQKLKKKR